MKTEPFAPLAPGSVAIRFRVEWRGNPARAVPVGVQAVVVVSVVGDRVVWTNGTRSRAGRDEFRHVSDRRELISLDALESVTAEFLAGLEAEISEPVAPAENPPSSPLLAGAGATGYGPRRRSAPWYRRDVEDSFPADAPDATNAAACCERAAAPFQSR